MRNYSKKRAALVRIYTKKRAEFLANSPWCARCGGEATEIHHKQGRRGLLLLDESRWVGVCHFCHVRITEHPLEALTEGWSLPRVGHEDGAA